MGPAAAILGVLGLVSVALGVPLMRPELFFGGGGLSVAAFILGFIGRESGGPAKAGMVLGLLGTVVCAGMFFLLSARAVPEAGGPPISVPAVIEAKPMREVPAKTETPAKIEAQPPAKIEAQPPS